MFVYQALSKPTGTLKITEYTTTFSILCVEKPSKTYAKNLKIKQPWSSIRLHP